MTGIGDLGPVAAGRLVCVPTTLTGSLAVAAVKIPRQADHSHLLEFHSAVGQNLSLGMTSSWGHRSTYVLEPLAEMLVSLRLVSSHLVAWLLAASGYHSGTDPLTVAAVASESVSVVPAIVAIDQS